MYLSRFRHPAFNCHHSITAISEETPSALKNVMCKTRTLQMMPVVFSQGKKKGKQPTEFGIFERFKLPKQVKTNGTTRNIIPLMCKLKTEFISEQTPQK